MSISVVAWQKSISLIEAIQNHPFNRELAIGCLAPTKFQFYLQQDSYYLKIFARCLALTAGRVPAQFLCDFLDFAAGAFIGEQELVHYIYQPSLKTQTTENLTMATLAYTEYLQNSCTNACYPVAVAALLPCFWIYQQVGERIAQQAQDRAHHPYQHWIETYSSNEFAAKVSRARAIFDDIGRYETVQIQSKMISAFYKSTAFEWHFWNDAYSQCCYDQLLSEPPISPVARTGASSC